MEIQQHNSPAAADHHMEMSMMIRMLQMDKLSPDFYTSSQNNSMSSTINNAHVPRFSGDTNVMLTSSPSNNNNNTISFPRSRNSNQDFYQQPQHSIEGMRDMIFRVAAMQPIQIDPESVKPPKRRNVRISTDPQSVAARHRRERISERIRILQRMVPGGTKMDTASMLDEAIHYVKFLKTQVQSLERAAAAAAADRPFNGHIGFPVPVSGKGGLYMGMGKGYQQQQYQPPRHGDAFN